MVGKTKSMSKKGDTTKGTNDTTVKEVDLTATTSPKVETKKMKSVWLTSTGSGSDYANIQLRDEDYPKIEKDHMVLVRIKAAGLNFMELMQRQGAYKPSQKTPYAMGAEGCGIVEEVSTNVTDLKKEDRVIIITNTGAWKETVMVPRSCVFKMPVDMSFEEGACFFVNYLTAYQILFRLANIKEGDSVLIHMAAGGVGLAATQLCKTIPNVTVFGTASASKHETIKQWGVDYPIDYTTSDYVEQIKKISAEGVDVVLDPLNGENAIKGYGLLKPLGKIIHYGTASLFSESRSITNMFKTWWKCLSISSLEIFSDNKSISGYHLGHLMNNESFFQTIQTDMNTLFELWNEKKIKIQVDSTFGYRKVGEAMKRMHQRLNIGKIVLKPDSEMPAAAPVLETEPVTASLEQVKLTDTDTDTDAEQKTIKTEDILTKAIEETKVEEEEAKVEKVEVEKVEIEKVATAPILLLAKTSPKIEEPVITKTNVSEITKPESTEGECATRE